MILIPLAIDQLEHFTHHLDVNEELNSIICVNLSPQIKQLKRCDLMPPAVCCWYLAPAGGLCNLVRRGRHKLAHAVLMSSNRRKAQERVAAQRSPVSMTAIGLVDVG